MPVPFIDLKRFESGFLDKWNAKVADLSAGARFIGGDEVSNLEKSLSSDNQVGFAISCANGTDALQLALRAAGVGPGDKVLIPDATFWATYEAVVNVGAVPCTVDIDLTDLQMDFDVFTKACEEIKPAAAMLVHLYGWASARLGDFRSYCKDKGIKLIEDGAQAYGCKINGDSIYKDALISTISFYPAKVFGAAGDAGAVLTSGAELAERVRSLGNHGREQHYGHGSVGWNSRMDTFQAAFLNLSLPHLEDRLNSRRKTAEIYRERLAPAGIKCIAPPAGYIENGYLNATLHENAVREKIVAAFKEQGIGFGMVYPGAMSDQKGAQGITGAQFGGEKARELAASILNLPLFPYMTDAEIEEVIGALKPFYPDVK